MKKNVVLKTKMPIPVYGGTLWLIVAKDGPQAYNDEIGRIGIGKHPDARSYFRARCAYSYKHGLFALFFHHDLSHAEIAHECGHFAIDVFDRVGAKIDPDNAEPFTYFLDAVTEWVYRQLKKAKIRVSI